MRILNINMTVGRQRWLLVLGLMVAMLLLMEAVLYWILDIESRLLTDVDNRMERITLSTELRGALSWRWSRLFPWNGKLIRKPMTVKNRVMSRLLSATK